MSVSTLLDSQSKLQQSVALNCFSLNAVNVTADNITAGNIVGRLQTNSNILTPASYTILAGSGTLSDVQRLVSRWTSNVAANGSYTRIDASARYTNVQAPFSAPSSVFVVDVTLPFSESMIYPASIGNLMPGSVNAVVKDGAAYTVSSCTAVRNTATSFTIYVAVSANISGASVTRELDILYSISYRVA